MHAYKWSRRFAVSAPRDPNVCRSPCQTTDGIRSTGSPHLTTLRTEQRLPTLAHLHLQLHQPRARQISTNFASAYIASFPSP